MVARSAFHAGFTPAEPPRVAVAADGTVAMIAESSRITILEIPSALAFAEIGIDPEAAASEVAWLGSPPRLLVLSRYDGHSTAHLLDPYGPRTIAEIRLESPMRLYATVGAAALVVGALGAAVLIASESHLTPYQFPARTAPTVAGAAAAQFLVALPGSPGSIEEWDPQSRIPKRRLRLPRTAAITAVGGSERLVWMTTQQEPARIDVIPLVNRGQPKAHDLPEPIASISGHPRSDLVACVGAETGRLYVVDLDGRTRLRALGPDGIDRIDAAGLVVGRMIGVLAAQAGHPVAIVPLDGRELEAASPATGGAPAGPAEGASAEPTGEARPPSERASAPSGPTPIASGPPSPPPSAPAPPAPAPPGPARLGATQGFAAPLFRSPGAAALPRPVAPAAPAAPAPVAAPAPPAAAPAARAVPSATPSSASERFSAWRNHMRQDPPRLDPGAPPPHAEPAHTASAAAASVPAAPGHAPAHAAPAVPAPAAAAHTASAAAAPVPAAPGHAVPAHAASAAAAPVPATPGHAVPAHAASAPVAPVPAAPGHAVPAHAASAAAAPVPATPGHAVPAHAAPAAAAPAVSAAAAPVPAAPGHAVPAHAAPAAAAPAVSAAAAPGPAAPGPAAPGHAVPAHAAPAVPAHVAAAHAAPAASGPAASATVSSAHTVATAAGSVGAPSAAALSWRDEVVAWSRGFGSGALDRDAPDAPPIDALIARFDLAPELRPALVLLYGAHLCGERGVAPAELARVLDRRWDEALGRGELAQRQVAVYGGSRVALSPVLLRVLDELPALTGTLVGEPGPVALLGPCVAVVPEAGDPQPLLAIAERCLPRLGGAIFVAHDEADLDALVLEARARGAAPMLRVVGGNVPNCAAILVIDDAELAERLGAPRLL